MIWKMSPLVKFDILGVFVKTMIADHKYPSPDFENLLCPIQFILSKNCKNFSKCFLPCLVFPANSKHFQTKEGRHS